MSGYIDPNLPYSTDHSLVLEAWNLSWRREKKIISLLPCFKCGLCEVYYVYLLHQHFELPYIFHLLLSPFQMQKLWTCREPQLAEIAAGLDGLALFPKLIAAPAMLGRCLWLLSQFSVHVAGIRVTPDLAKCTQALFTWSGVNTVALTSEPHHMLCFLCRILHMRVDFAS